MFLLVTPTFPRPLCTPVFLALPIHSPPLDQEQPPRVLHNTTQHDSSSTDAHHCHYQPHAKLGIINIHSTIKSNNSTLNTAPDHISHLPTLNQSCTSDKPWKSSIFSPFVYSFSSRCKCKCIFDASTAVRHEKRGVSEDTWFVAR